MEYERVKRAQNAFGGSEYDLETQAGEDSHMILLLAARTVRPYVPKFARTPCLIVAQDCLD